MSKVTVTFDLDDDPYRNLTARERAAELAHQAASVGLRNWTVVNVEEPPASKSFTVADLVALGLTQAVAEAAVNA